ncbi:TKL protein kinase [Fonticula alba]|uniref:TKL protein kinase n=1 Tax=Fonticula alba TaxID=691883 RepID=A0A058Z2H4_FONAL|nr:TKL protein kinase [Fonticula alba]KCV68133.1 TKL protein kinase [Fonticula alba]|eukprot:XP_009497507.1 TKL protein kinase [Fonticula alba]
MLPALRAGTQLYDGASRGIRRSHLPRNSPRPRISPLLIRGRSPPPAPRPRAILWLSSMLRPRRRPAGPLRAALRLLLGLGALLACGLASTPVGLLRSAGPLHFALPPGAAGTLGAFHSGQPSQLVVSPPDQPATLHRQTAILTTYQDIRLGSLFGRAPSDPLPGPPGGDTAPDVQLIISPSPNGPCLFSLSSANAGFFRAGQWLLNPIAAGAVALAHTAFESNTAFLLLHWPDSNQLKLATFPNTGMAKVIDLGTAMAGPAPLAAAAGTPLAFLTARGTQVKVFFPTANGQGMANSFATNLPAPVVGSPIITRLRPGDPALALFLLNSGQVASYAIDYNNLSSHGDIYVPDGAAADARLFGASCLELGPNDGGPLFLANPGPDGRLWRLNVDTGGHLAGWTELRLPAGTLAGALRPVLLNTATGPMWTLADSHAYLQADVFGCSTTDPTISCSATEYTCASGSVPSGLLMDGRLCAGCEDGTTASSPWSAAAPCTACMQAGCLVCHDASCLHCPAGTLPQTDMQSGDTVCVSSCAAGYHAAGGRCLPVMPRRPRGLTHPEPRFQGPGGSGAPPMSGARLLAPTCLATANGQLSLLLDPPSGRASDTRLLLFHSDPQHKPAILHANVFSGPPAAGPLFDVHPLDLWPADAPTFTHFLNLLPVEQTSGAPAAALLGCHGHTLHWGKVMCNGPASLAGSCAAYFGTFTDTEAPCYGLRALAPNLAAVLGARSGLRLAMLHPSGGIRMQSLPGYIQPPAVLPLLSHSSAVSDWLLAVGPQQSGFLPLNMALVQDPRLEAAPPALRHMVPDGWVPVALPHKTRSLAEVFLTGLHHDSPPGGETPPAWVVEHVPLSGGEAQWTVAGLSTQEQVLGRLPVDPGPDVHFRVLSTPGDVNVPSALLLLSPRVVGFAQLQCLQLGGCWLRDAWFQVLSADLAFDPALALPLPQNASPSTRVDMLVIRPGIGLATLALEEQCGSDFSDPNPCVPCHPRCATCSGSSPSQCISCSLAAWREPFDCLDYCPEGLVHQGNQCVCHDTCSECQKVPSTERYQCQACQAGWALEPGAHPVRCLQCHDSCSMCTAGEDPAACTACHQGHYLQGSQCLDSCPVGLWPDNLLNRCQPCPEVCLSCTSTTHCTLCRPGFIPAGGQCRLCHSSCLSCTDEVSCSACRPGLVFLDPDPGMPSLCGSTCPPGEFPGPERCTRCDRSCDLCAGGAARCLVCAEGFRWDIAAPGPGKTGACVPCPAGCASCIGTGPGTSRCLSCGAEHFLTQDGTCAGSCPAATFGETTQWTCQPCDVSCGACLGGGADQCTGCAAGLELVEVTSGAGTCVSGCPEGQYRAGTDCLPCDAACATCNGPTDKDCWRCASGVLQDGDCVQACAAQHVAVADRCLPCHPSCGSCTGVRSTECTACPGGLLALPAGQTPGRCPGGMAHDDEDATVMNTMLELSLPGSILVSIANDFAPLNEEALGAGTQASVYAARAVGAGISDRLGCPGTVAIKQLKAARMTPTQVTLFQNEVALMWLLRDAPNVVRLYGYSEQPPAIVMERYQTDLATLLHSEVPLAPHVLLDMCQQWASGLEAMHAQGIAHRDLKPGNVFVSQRPDGGWRAALGDLGTSRNLNTDRSSTLVSQAPELNAMTARYAAPEVLAAFHRKRPLDCELFLPADIYSAAIMLWECLMRTVPWQGRDFEQISSGVLAGERPAIAFDGPLADLLPLAWDANPHARPPAASLRQKAAMAALSTEMP